MFRPTGAEDAIAWAQQGDRAALERLLLAHSAISPRSAAAVIALARAEEAPLSAIEAHPCPFDERERDSFISWQAAARESRATSDPLPLLRALEAAPPDDIEPIPLPEEGGRITVALDPEPPRPVPIPQRPFSASALNMFVDCRRRWFFRYVCDPVEEPDSPAASYGTAFHSALEHFHSEFSRPSETIRNEMQKRLDELVVAAFERARSTFSTAVEVDLQTRRARRMAIRYIDWLCERQRQLPFEVVGIEQRVSPTIGDHQFVGFIDRIDRLDGDGSLAVLDYKTGSIAESAKEYRERVRRFEDFQLPFYYWSQQLLGERVSRLALVPLKDHTLAVTPIELEVVPGDAPTRDNGPRGTISIIDLERARDRMIAIGDEIRSATIERFPASEDPDSCAYCIYTLACTARPPAAPERFAR